MTRLLPGKLYKTLRSHDLWRKPDANWQQMGSTHLVTIPIGAVVFVAKLDNETPSLVYAQVIYRELIGWTHVMDGNFEELREAA